jgi:hypothetical protein
MESILFNDASSVVGTHIVCCRSRGRFPIAMGRV